jgi:hypothetical protein
MINFPKLFSRLAKPSIHCQQFSIMKIPIVLFISLFAISVPAFSQNNGSIDPSLNPNQNENTNNQEQTDEVGKPGYWEAKLGGGEYVVALNRISSVSRHTYVLDGALIVDEVTIDTTGQALARFYFISPITSGVPGAAVSQVAENAMGLVDSAARTAGSDLQNMVVKKYPLTTHAKTIEYRLLSEAQLNVLFQSAKTAWQTGKGRIFTGR